MIPREDINAVTLAAMGLVQELIVTLKDNGKMTEGEILTTFRSAIDAQMQVGSDANIAAARILMYIQESVASPMREGPASDG